MQQFRGATPPGLFYRCGRAAGRIGGLVGNHPPGNHPPAIIPMYHTHPQAE
jgi:hypothetical protein